MTRKVLLLAALTSFYVAAQNTCDLIEWTGGQFDWPNSGTKSIYKSSGRYISKNIIATRGQIFRDEIFLALPRFKPGVPVTLAKVNFRQKGCEAVLSAFPCWATQEIGEESAFQNVVDLYLDENNILWVLDIGVVNTFTSKPIRNSPPKVVAINVLTGKKVKTLDFAGLVCEASRLQYIAVEYTSDGKPYVYVSDAATRSILVFDVTENRNYRVVMPRAITSSRRDVLYIALVHKACYDNYLIITYLSGSRIYRISTEYLRSGCTDGRIQDLGPKDGKVIVLGTDLGSGLFFRFEGKPDVYRWEVSRYFKDYEVVYKSPECYLATQVMPDVSRHRVRVLESNFPDFIQDTVGCGASQRVALMVSCVN